MKTKYYYTYDIGKLFDDLSKRSNELMRSQDKAYNLDYGQQNASSTAEWIEKLRAKVEMFGYGSIDEQEWLEIGEVCREYEINRNDYSIF